MGVVLVIIIIFGDRNLSQSENGLNPWEAVELSKVISEMEDVIVFSTCGTGPFSIIRTRTKDARG